MKLIKRFIFAFLFIVIGMTTVFAADNIVVEIDGQRVSFSDQQPIVKDGRTLVPVRGVFEQLGYNVGWDGNTQTATLSNSVNTVLITLGKTAFTTNGKTYSLDVPAQAINGRTMLPLRAVLESVGYGVDWDGGRSAVIISSKTTNNNSLVTPTLSDLQGSWKNGQQFYLFNEKDYIYSWDSGSTSFLGEFDLINDGLILRQLAYVRLDKTSYNTSSKSHIVKISSDKKTLYLDDTPFTYAGTNKNNGDTNNNGNANNDVSQSQKDFSEQTNSVPVTFSGIYQMVHGDNWYYSFNNNMEFTIVSTHTKSYNNDPYVGLVDTLAKGTYLDSGIRNYNHRDNNFLIELNVKECFELDHQYQKVITDPEKSEYYGRTIEIMLDDKNNIIKISNSDVVKISGLPKIKLNDSYFSDNNSTDSSAENNQRKNADNDYDDNNSGNSDETFNAEIFNSLVNIQNTITQTAKDTYTYLNNASVTIHDLAYNNSSVIGKSDTEKQQIAKRELLSAANTLDNSIDTMKRGLNTLKNEGQNYPSIVQFCTKFDRVISTLESISSTMKTTHRPSDINIGLSDLKSQLNNL